MGQQVDDLWMGAATGPQTAGWSNGGNPGVIGRGVGPLGRVYVWDIVPAAKSTTAVCNAQAAAAAGNLTINGASATAGVVTFADARAVMVDTNNTANTTQSVTVTGTDYYGQAQTETIDLNGTTDVSGKKAFKTITQVYVDDAITGTINVGSTDIFGLPYRITNAGYVVHAGWDNTLAADAGTFVAADTTSPATATTGDVRGTYTPSSAADGSKRLVMTLALTALQAGPNATQTAAIGVTPV
jgi:hypothetical protein